MKRDSFFNLRLNSGVSKNEEKNSPVAVPSDDNEARFLAASNSRKGFISNISHELRTSLSMTPRPIDSIQKNENLSDREVQLLRIIRKNGDKSLELMNSILTLRKLDPKKSKREEDTIDLFDFTKRVTSSFESLAEKSEIQYSFDYQASRNLILRMDRYSLTLMLYNIICNAFKFTPPGGAVSVTIEDLFNSIRISVTDTGCGIPQKDLSYIFGPSYHVNSKLVGETGKGLAIVKECAELIDAEVLVDSVINEGSVFTLLLKRKQILTSQRVETKDKEPIGENVKTNNRNLITSSKPKVVTTEPPVESNKTAGSKWQNTILVVEDNYSIRDYLKIMLGEYFTIVTSKNGREALDYLEICKDLNHIVILSDIMMPVMDGYQLIEIIKGENRFKHIPVIMLTAIGDHESKLKALSLGANDYLLKPFEEKELKIKLQKLFDGKLTRKQINAFKR